MEGIIILILIAFIFGLLINRPVVPINGWGPGYGYANRGIAPYILLLILGWFFVPRAINWWGSLRTTEGQVVDKSIPVSGLGGLPSNDSINHVLGIEADSLTDVEATNSNTKERSIDQQSSGPIIEYSVQIGSYNEDRNAVQALIEAQNISSLEGRILVEPWVNSDTIYRVRMGKFEVMEDASALRKDLLQEFPDCYVTKHAVEPI